MSERLKILVSAYACQPGRGSEPGVGWNWASYLAREHEAWIITRENNREHIEAELERDPLPNAHFVFYDLPLWARFWKRGWLGVQIYYYLWQIGIYFVAKRLTRTVPFDLAHHMTFVKYWSPSFLSMLGVPFVWGPVGGGESAPRAFRSAFSLRGQLYDIARSAARTLGSFDPFVRLTARRARVGLAATEDTADCLRALGCRNVRVFPAVALSNEDLALLRRVPIRREGPFRLISLGNLLHLKGFDMAIQGFARFLQNGGEGEYWLVGGGPERQRLEALAERLGIAGRVRFWGHQPRADAIRILADCDVLAHPTLHDSGGWVCLEASAAARPVVCLDLGGPALQVTPETGIKIPAHNPEQVIADLATAFATLAANPDLRQRLGEAGRARANRDYRWEDKPARFIKICAPETFRQGVLE
jgi:glycosyltransferase involved in cell wall biosynthesis